MTKIKNVLGLFDGISVGQKALKDLNIEFENYYACETDKYAIAITQYHFPNTIQLGDIRELNPDDLPEIDLIFAGFPCPSFSKSGRQGGFEDERGKLFYELTRILDQIQPKYFLAENVAMKKEYEAIITESLKVNPIMIDSRLLAPQTRCRLYWTNIKDIKQPEDKQVFFQDIREEEVSDNFYYGERAWNWIKNHSKRTNKKLRELNAPNVKMQCLEATMAKKYSSQRFFGITDAKGTRYITPNECELCQTLPKFYTKWGMTNKGKIQISNTQRYKLAGNCWTLDVIKHILKHLPLNEDISSK